MHLQYGKYRAMLAYMAMQSDQALYCCLANIKFFFLKSSKLIMDRSKNGKLNCPFSSAPARHK